MNNSDLIKAQNLLNNSDNSLLLAAYELFLEKLISSANPDSYVYDLLMQQLITARYIRDCYNEALID